jgi:hypothetical protein
MQLSNTDSNSGVPKKFDYDSPPLASKLIDFKKHHYYMGENQSGLPPPTNLDKYLA